MWKPPRYRAVFAIIDHIGLFELGDNGTCTHLVADCWLEKKAQEE